jgi:cardiolipin synthase
MIQPQTTRRAVLAGLPALAACAQIPIVPDGPADPMERHALLVEQLDGAPLLAGNKVDVLDGGVAMFEAAFRAIAGATDHVNLEFYILQDVRIPGTTGPSLFELLLLKLAQGVAVTIIHDGYGSLGSDFGPLQAAGARTLQFHPLSPLEARTDWLPNDRDHRKMLIVDGRIGIMGGINLDHVYENPCGTGVPQPDTEAACWHDTSIRIEGPTVGAMQTLFLETWAKEGGAALPPRNWHPALTSPGPARIRMLGSAPGEKRPRYYVTLLTAIAAARCPAWGQGAAAAAACQRQPAGAGCATRHL